MNIQGDEPFISPRMLEEVVTPLFEDPELPMCTLMNEIPEESFQEPTVVKVVTDLAGNALYFSRSLIPYPRNRQGHKAYEHVGIYAYRREFLLTYTTLEPTPLERFESLEQLGARARLPYQGGSDPGRRLHPLECGHAGGPGKGPETSSGAPWKLKGFRRRHYLTDAIRLGDNRDMKLDEKLLAVNKDTEILSAYIAADRIEAS